MTSYSIQSLNLDSNETSSISIESIDTKSLSGGDLHFALNNQKRTRIVHSSTKSRSDFTSGGAKPYKQKGTGRARMGTTRSPLKVGGAVIFGPKPRVVQRKTNKHYFSRIVKQLLLHKMGESSLYVNTTNVNKAADFSKRLNQDQSYLYILDMCDHNDIRLFCRVKNIPNIYFSSVFSLQIEDILRCDRLIYSSSSFDWLFGEDKRSR